MTNTQSNDLYNLNEIKALLKHYHFAPIEVRADIDKSLQSVLITGEMYLFIAMHYTHKFSLIKTGRYMGYSLREIMELNENTLEVLSALLNGYKTAYRKKPVYLLSVEWAQLLIMQIISPFNTCFFDDELLKADSLGMETLKQRETGIPSHILDDLFNASYSADIFTERATKNVQKPYELETFILNDRRNNKIRSLFESE